MPIRPGMEGRWQVKESEARGRLALEFEGRRKDFHAGCGALLTDGATRTDRPFFYDYELTVLLLSAISD